jgi:acetyl esterase
VADLDPDLARLAEAAVAKSPLASLTPQQARDRVREGDGLCAGGPEMWSVTDTTVEHAGAAVPVRVYRPTAEPTHRTLVYAHGGGWVTGDLQYADEPCRFLAREAGCTVVCVDYRLAPEHRHPAALDDVETVVRWVTQHEPGMFAVAGDSAGANLAAACTLRLRDAGGPPPRFQALLYPVVDHNLARPSYVSTESAFPMGVKDMQWFFDHYVPDAPHRDHPSVSPLRHPSLDGLPPALVVLAGHDPLHDQGAAYADRLRAAGVPVALHDHPALCHGFLRFTAVSRRAAAARDAIVAEIAAFFERDPRHGDCAAEENHAYDFSTAVGATVTAGPPDGDEE